MTVGKGNYLKVVPRTRSAAVPQDGGVGAFEAVFLEIEELQPVQLDLSIDQATVQNDGGYPLVITNSVPFADTRYTVHVGPNGTAADPSCYSGVVGDGYQPRVNAAGTGLSVYTPVLPIGGPYIFFLVDSAGNGTQSETMLLTVIAHFFRSGIKSMRKKFTGWKTGYRDPSEEEFPQT